MEGTLSSFDQRIRASFHAAKNDILNLQRQINDHRAVFEQQNASIKALMDNQKALLIRIRELEKKQFPEKVIVKEAKPLRVFIGATSSMVVHDPVCPYAKNIKPDNKVPFASLQEALNAGYKACDCLKSV